MLNITDLAVGYGMHEALLSVSLHVAADEIVVILGANGAGKSTLLKAVAGVCEGHTAGDISMDGRSVVGLDPAEIVESGIAFVPEGRGIFGDLSVHENLLLGAYADHARPRQQDNFERVMTLFPKLGERQRQIANTMSGGEQQMVAIGRALMSAPSILMLDEPSLGLSPLLCKELFSSLKQVRDSGVGILLVEQNAKQSLSIADRGYLLENGQIIGHDSASHLLHDPAVQAAYLGGAVANVQQPLSSMSITPRPALFAAPTITADSLVGEDINAMVARATSAALHRDVSILATTPSVHATNATLPQRKRSKPVLSSVTGSVLPATPDVKVQQLIADLEAAALNASSTDKKYSAAGSSSGLTNEREVLPHIPVFRKSTVTVYRRDSTGKLRKQERQ